MARPFLTASILSASFIVRSFVAQPERVEDELPVSQELSNKDTVEPQRQEQPTPLDYPQWGLV
jgi:hypothetical protein